jgi:cell division protein FtsL
MHLHFSEDKSMNKKLIAALFAGAFAFASATAIADDKTPPAPVDQAKLKADRDAAKAKWASMTPEQQAATRKAMQAKRVSELSSLEMVAQEGDASNPANMPTGMDATKFKSEREAAKAKWDSMTPDQKSATRKAAQAKKLSELSMLERMSVGQ